MEVVPPLAVLPSGLEGPSAGCHWAYVGAGLVGLVWGRGSCGAEQQRQHPVGARGREGRGGAAPGERQ